MKAIRMLCLLLLASITAGFYVSDLDSHKVQVLSPPFSVLILGPAGAERLGGATGDTLFAMHVADVWHVVLLAADSMALTGGTKPQCNRYYMHDDRVVVLFSNFCVAAQGPGGRDYGVRTMVSFRSDGRVFGFPLRWNTDEEMRVVR